MKCRLPTNLWLLGASIGLVTLAMGVHSESALPGPPAPGAQAGGGGRGGAPPQLLSCGAYDDIDVICGTQGPEDLELAPDGRYLIVSQFSIGGTGGGTSGGLALFDPDAGTFAPMGIVSDRREGWGEAACPGPMTAPIAAHGISLGRHPQGMDALYVVNHGGRETVEMFEMRPSGDSWELVWHGCAVASEDYNDVAILPDGGYVATRPTALQVEGGNVFAGGTSGNVARWTPLEGESVLPGTEAGYPNGVIADPDGRYIYIAAWTGRQVRKYDLNSCETLDILDLDFMPDNLSWTADGEILAAGISGFGGEAGFSVAGVDPAAMTARTLYEPAAGALPITGVSVALEVGDAIYIGAFQGDRIVRVR
jgi:hypothetical protein